MEADRQRQSTLHTVIMKDLGHVSKRQGMMITIQHIVQELKKMTYCHIVALSVFPPGPATHNTI